MPWVVKKKKRYYYIPTIKAACRFHWQHRAFSEILEDMPTVQKQGSPTDFSDDWGAWKRRKFAWPSERDQNPWI